MDDTTLFAFAQKILSQGSQDKSIAALRQLHQILYEQDAPQHQLDILMQMIDSVPELKAANIGDTFTPRDLVIAHQRARVRIQREQEARRNGRC